MLLKSNQWAVILGVSSGIGAGVARALARQGYAIFGVHLDLADKSTEVAALRNELENFSGKAVFFNGNAAGEAAQIEALALLKEVTLDGNVSVLVHSLAFGALLPFIASSSDKPMVSRRQMDMTLNVMAHSLVYWTQGICSENLMAPGGKIFAMTSAGSSKVTAGYGAVSAAKAALESHVRQLALELAPKQIAVNGIRAGVTDTPAMRKIPGSDRIVATVQAANPYHRLTTPEDVGAAIAALCQLDSTWMTGNVIGVDGGEFHTA